VRVAIVGGKLQGVEAAFLAREAGWEVLLVDRKPSPPASGLCHSFHQCDVVKDAPALCRLVEKERVDLIVPALEDAVALRALEKCAGAVGTPLAYDAAAYSVTHSKKRSNRLFEKLGIPLPRSWPQCELPLMVKPSVSSGSQGVARIDSEKEFSDFVGRVGAGLEDWVLQEYLEGPSYSIEVLGLDGHYIALQVTELEMDARYDCKRVLAPARISASLERRIKDIALTIARGLHLKGIMDVELVLDRGVLKVFEIDARLPSQTPTAVYRSTGINMLKLLGDIFVKDTLPPVPEVKAVRGVVYEHVKVSGTSLEIVGEHIMAEAGPLEMTPRFFGADVGLSNFNQAQLPLVATLVTSGESLEQAWLGHERVIENIRDYLEGAGCLEDGSGDGSGGAGLAAAPLSGG